MEDHKAGTTYDYTRRGGVLAKTLHLPHALTLSRAEVWNEAERAENRKNSTVARECEVSLPVELAPQAQIDLANAFGRYLVARHGCAADVNVHTPTRKNDSRNTHAHILLTTRRFTPEGVLGEKCRELDAAKTGSAEITAWRMHWADLCNQALQEAGLKNRVDARSLAAQGLALVPTIHVGTGPQAWQRRAFNEAARADNQAAADLDLAIKVALMERAQLVAAQIVTDARQRARVRARALQAQNDQARAPQAGRLDTAGTPLTLEQIQAAKDADPEALRRALAAEQATLAQCAEIDQVGRHRLHTARPQTAIDQAKQALPAAAQALKTAQAHWLALRQEMQALGLWGRLWRKKALGQQLAQADAQRHAARDALQATRTLARATVREQVLAVLKTNEATRRAVSVQIEALQAQLANLVPEAAPASPVPPAPPLIDRRKVAPPPRRPAPGRGGY